MSGISKIEWTETTWNPIAGCTKVSPGCKNCYAEKMSARLAAMAKSDRIRGNDPVRKDKYRHVVNERGRWNGNIRLDYQALYDPLHWKHSRIVFVNSMSDLFHPKVPLDFIKRAFDVMGSCPQHIFQVLTKRPEYAEAHSKELTWFPNIWMGTTVENSSVLHRVGILRKIPAKVRFLSLEPLLGPISRLPLKGVHWVIVGGESGPGFRHMDPMWARTVRDRCVHQGVPFFFKQWSGVHPKKAGRKLDGRIWDEMPLNTARRGVHGQSYN